MNRSGSGSVPIVYSLACALAASLTGVVLLAKVHGFTEMHVTVPALVVPSAIALIVVMTRARHGRYARLSEAIAIGLFGGLLSTLAYDLTRLPFHIVGYNVFATNSTYGLWVLDASHHSRITETAGWAYHFSNGLLFSVMYSLFGRGLHWIWAIVYAFALESIAVFSNFGQVFSLAGNYGMIGIAYLAHVSYALPIGLMVQRWDDVIDWMREKRWVVTGLYLIFAASFLPGLFAPSWIARDAASEDGVFVLEAKTLSPYMQRLDKGGRLMVENRSASSETVRNNTTGETLVLAPGETGALAFETGGIYQVFVENTEGTTSSFVIVEPAVEAAGRALF